MKPDNPDYFRIDDSPVDPSGREGAPRDSEAADEGENVSETALRAENAALRAALRRVGCTCRAYPHDPTVSGCSLTIARAALSLPKGRIKRVDSE